MTDERNDSARASYDEPMTRLLAHARAVCADSEDIEDAIDRVLMGWFTLWREDPAALLESEVDGALLLEVLVLRHEQFVYAQAWQIVRRLGLIEEEAFDLTSEVFLTLIEKPHGYVSRAGGRFRGYLRTLTRNKAIDLYRKKKRRKTYSEHERRADDAGPQRATDHEDARVESMEAALTRQNLMEVFLDAYNARLDALKLRTPRQHEAWHLCVVKGLNSTEAAAATGSSPATIRRNKTLAAKSLRSFVDDFCREHELNPKDLLSVFS